MHHTVYKHVFKNTTLELYAIDWLFSSEDFPLNWDLAKGKVIKISF